MCKNFTTIVALVLLSNVANAQEMNGFRTDNYNGVNGAFFNPANLANNQYKLDVSLFGINVFAGNKNVDFSYKTISEFGDSSNLKKLTGIGEPNNIMTNVALHLPSVSFAINSKTTVAFLSRARVLVNMNDIDGDLINSIEATATNGGASVTAVNSTNMRISINALAEFGLAGGRVLYDKGNHYLKAGVTLKYLGGIGNTYLQLNNLNATIKTDSNGANTYATNTSGSLAMGAGGINIDNFDDVDFKLNATGFGADLGLVYEYRPGYLSEDRNKYLFKVSAAILDLGRIKFTAIPGYTVGYNINIPAGQQFGLDTLSGKNGSEIQTVLNGYPQYFSKTAGLNNSSYNVALPTTLQLGGDVRLIKRIYVAANAQLGLANNKSNPYNPNSVTGITLTPRFETKMLAAYMPIHYNNLGGAAIGFGFRAGPLYMGSSSILSMAFTKSKQADFYFGLRIGLKSKKESK